MIHSINQPAKTYILFISSIGASGNLSQLTIFKIAHSVHHFALILALQGVVGWVPCQFRQWINEMRFWNRVLSFDGDRITRMLFELDYLKCTNNWCSDMKYIVQQLDMEIFVFISKSTIDFKE